MNAIQTVNLTKYYKELCALDHLNLEVKEGELFGLLGVNGAGKTTAIKMLTCLISPDDGDAFLQGHSIKSEPNAVKSIIGVSPQQTAIAPSLRVKENLELLCGIFRLSKEEAEAKISDLTKTFSLSQVLDRRAGKLSGGWQRRLSIALALISEPQILFLDEPTLGLDVIARADLWDSIRALKGKKTIVLTTHYMEEAEALCDRIAILKDGHLLGVQTPADWKEKTGSMTLEEAFVKTVRAAQKEEEK